ncbi:MAG TPA: hypothetical protein VII87_12000 [Solirubrobacteraceae bacterium]
MRAGLHAISWSLSRLAVVLGVALLAAVLGYVGLVFVLVVIQAAGALGQG